MLSLMSTLADLAHLPITVSGGMPLDCFRWHAIRLFNYLPKCIRCTTSCSVYSFINTLDSYFTNIVDHQYVPGFNNIQDGGYCIKWRTLRDDLAAN